MPLAAPTAAELLQNSVVQKALLDAWNDSQPTDPALRHEEGGWIYMDVSNGKISVERAIRGSHHRIDLSRPVVILMSVVVGKFHTHPNPTSEG